MRVGGFEGLQEEVEQVALWLEVAYPVDELSLQLVGLDDALAAGVPGPPSGVSSLPSIRPGPRFEALGLLKHSCRGELFVPISDNRSVGCHRQQDLVFQARDPQRSAHVPDATRVWECPVL